ncbi:hypothetical protein [Alsobacter sp. SYSU BS001988]
MTGSTEKDRRTQRLAAALRDNLKRRKAQARSRVDGAEARGPEGPADEAPADPPTPPTKPL